MIVVPAVWSGQGVPPQGRTRRTGLSTAVAHLHYDTPPTPRLAGDRTLWPRRAGAEQGSAQQLVRDRTAISRARIENIVSPGEVLVACWDLAPPSILWITCAWPVDKMFHAVSRRTLVCGPLHHEWNSQPFYLRQCACLWGCAACILCARFLRSECRTHVVDMFSTARPAPETVTASRANGRPSIRHVQPTARKAVHGQQRTRPGICMSGGVLLHRFQAQRFAAGRQHC